MGFFARLFHAELIEIEGGRAVSVKGKHPSGMLSDIGDVCREFGVESGRISFDGSGKLGFSRHFPEAAHQALRNVIVSQL